MRHRRNAEIAVMPSPFPGMDPYLEAAVLWPAFQHQFVAGLYQILLPGLVDRYRARVAQRTYVTEVALFTSVVRDQHAEEFIEVRQRGDGRLDVQFDEWDNRYPLGLEIMRGAHSAIVPVTGPCNPLRLEELAYERRSVRFDQPEPAPANRPHTWRTAVRSLLDWETVTPIDDLPTDSLPGRLKRELRRWHANRKERQEASTSHELSEIH